MKKIVELLDLLKFSHTIFALPFALASLLIASGGLPSARLFLLIVLAMVIARNAGMAFNRYLDSEIDAKNPRTQSRHIPQGIFSRKFVLTFSLTNAILFVAVASQINAVCFKLSFVALALLFFYSYAKRFTAWSHLILGLVLGISPVGAWIAVRGRIDFEPILLALAVIFWVAGFDIIYGTQDYDFDRRQGLHSLVVRFGIAKSLLTARAFHIATVILLFLFGNALHFGAAYYLTLAIITFLFFYEHSLVSSKDLTRVNAAFFNVNGFISIVFLSGVTLSL